MTSPRQVLRNAAVLLTRRCSERRMFLRPSRQLNDLVLYILAVAAQRFEVQVHAYCMLSNHLHLVLTDPRAVLPAFEQYFASLVARACNALLGRWESFWAPGSYSAVTLSTPGDVLDKMAYVLANPVSAGLVQEASEWPGLWSSPELIAGPALTVKRPEHFFRPDGAMPDVASLSVVAPPGVASVEDFRGQLASAVAEREAQASKELRSQGRTVLGVRAILKQKPFSRPAPGEPRRGLNPRVAGRDKWKRIEAIARLKGFLRDYRAAWLDFTRGVRDVVFPHGTYWMRVAYGLPCAPAG